MGQVTNLRRNIKMQIVSPCILLSVAPQKSVTQWTLCHLRVILAGDDNDDSLKKEEKLEIEMPIEHAVV